MFPIQHCSTIPGADEPVPTSLDLIEFLILRNGIQSYTAKSFNWNTWQERGLYLILLPELLRYVN